MDAIAENEDQPTDGRDSKAQGGRDSKAQKKRASSKLSEIGAKQEKPEKSDKQEVSGYYKCWLSRQQFNSVSFQFFCAILIGDTPCPDMAMVMSLRKAYRSILGRENLGNKMLVNLQHSSPEDIITVFVTSR